MNLEIPGGANAPFAPLVMQLLQNKLFKSVLPTSLGSDKVEKGFVPRMKAENLTITTHFMHFCEKSVRELLQTKTLVSVF